MDTRNKAMISYIFIIACTFSLVSCDLSIIDRNKNIIVFQTGSVLIRSSECGSLSSKKPSVIVMHTKPYTGKDSIPSPPITFTGRLMDNIIFKSVSFIDSWVGTQLLEKFEKPSFVLLIELDGDSTCDLHKKLKQVASSGYSAIILSTTEDGTSFFQKFNSDFRWLKSFQKSGLDIHLINPWDIGLLEKYAFHSAGRQYGLESPSREESNHCKFYYSEIWKRVSMTELKIVVAAFILIFGVTVAAMAFIKMSFDDINLDDLFTPPSSPSPLIDCSYTLQFPELKKQYRDPTTAYTKQNDWRSR